MRTVTGWTDHLPENDGVKTSINDIAFRPDGAQLVAAGGSRVLVYDAATGDRLLTLKGHKDTCYSVSYSSDGKRFASGGADKTVIIWTSKGDGILKYQHNDSVLAVSYNPVTLQLASVTQSDFGLWSAEQKSVQKHKLPSRGLCCAWTTDGQHLAIGMFNGVVTLRARTGEEKVQIKRTAPIWTLSWNPSREDGLDVLAVGSWDQKLSFYALSGKQVSRDKDIGFDPCCVSYFANGDYLLVSGSDRKAGLFTKDGTFLQPVCETSDWVWGVRHRPKQLGVAVCTNDGYVATYQLVFSTIHSIFQEQYVFRDMMTDVVVQQLTSDKKLRIACHDYVKKVAIYRDRLAVQTSDRIHVFELFYDDQYELRYKEKEKIKKQLECSLLCVTAFNLVLCQDKRITAYDFKGNKRREWVLESVIRYIKVIGGLPERESLLVGLKSGAVLKIFLENPFPVQLIKLNVPVRCLDISSSRMKLAVVDENSNCLVYDLRTKELRFQESNANAVSWNTECEDMLCYSGNGVLNIKTGTLPPFQQRLQGFVVGFKGSKVFSLHYSVMSTLDVPHSHALYRYIERREFDRAYEVACLGIPEGDWKMLGMHAMSNLALDIARKSFVRVRDVKFVELLNRIELDRRVSGGNDALLLGDILAFQGKYTEAARCFVKSGQEDRAIDMFCDMKMWAEASAVCTNEEHLKELIKRQARWSDEIGDKKEAARHYLAAGEPHRAIVIMGDQGLIGELIEVMRALPKSDASSIAACGDIFRRHNDRKHAIEAYERIGDSKALLQLHVEMNLWEEAFALLRRFPQFAADVYVPYAAWLSMSGRYQEAQEAFKKAQRPQEARRMMEQLATNSVMMKCFGEAAFYFHKLASECGATEADKKLTPDDANRRVEKYGFYRRRAELYYAYAMTHRYVTQPFTSVQPVALFNASKYLLTMLSDNEEVPFNICKLDVLLALGRLTTSLEMFRMARTIHERMQQYVVPVHTMEQLDVATMIMRGRPYQDKEELLPVCFRCSQTNSSFTVAGDRCAFCMHKFVRSWSSFEVLPLVEFVLSEGLSDVSAEHILLHGGGGSRKTAEEWSEKADGGANVMTFNDDPVDAALGGGTGGGDPFARQLMQIELSARDKTYRPIVCNLDHLKAFKRDEIFVVRHSEVGLPIRNQYFRNMVPSFRITMCGGCRNFFVEAEFEFALLKGTGCPVCRWRR